MNIKEAMQQRKSIRTYREEPVSEDLRQNLNDFINSLKTTFSTDIRFKLVDMENLNPDIKLGTYGVIKGAKTFICAVSEIGNKNEEKLGYAFEKIILHATELGLGTCWMGGTFNRPEFAKAVELKQNEMLPVISPVGYAKEKRSLLDSVMVMAAGSRSRKEWSELFFDKDFRAPVKKDDAGTFKEVLEMVRIAPSASNKQPWRIVKDGNKFYFYLARNVGYGNALGYDIQRLDIGISMCHFETMLNELGFSGKWDYVNPGLSTPANVEFITAFSVN